MKDRFIFLFALVAVSAARGAGTARFSHEPFVIETYRATARFENDGTGEEDLRVRVRIQTGAGVAAWSELDFAYDSERERVDVPYVRIHKADGATLPIPADAIKDIPAPPARDFPAYAHCKEKQVTLRSLAPGDTLEYEVAKRIGTPAAPNQFWFEHSFLAGAVVVDERLEINLPATRQVTLKSSASSPYQTTEAEGRKIYSWKSTHLKPQPSAPEDQDRKSPDVELTTFSTWNEVGSWYAALLKGRDEPTPEIRTKTEELIRGRAQEGEKAEALYDYVRKNIRDVALPLGAAGYQPHPAAEVLSHQYGDGQDKHALLAAMLRAAGIPAEAILIPSARRFDPSFPSPAPFDRVITRATAGGDVVLMDSAVDVAPYGMLAAGLRNKSALLVSSQGGPRIVQTPPDPPFPSTQHVTIEGQVSELGKLTAHAHYWVRGDTELVLRSAFHGAEPAQFQEIAQTILRQDGIEGEVTSVKPSEATATRDPFELAIDFSQPNFVEWSSKTTRAALPLLTVGMPDPPADKTKPIDLGSPLEVEVQLKLSFPATLAARPPAGLTLSQDFAEFRSAYRFEGHMLVAERVVDFKMRQVPPGRAAEYAPFLRAVAADASQPLVVENISPGGPAIPASATPEELLEAGRACFKSGNSKAAIAVFQRVAELSPRDRQVWNDLGLAYLSIGKLDEAIAAFQSQLAANPSDQHANQYLGLAFERELDYTQAAAAFRKQTETNPLDPVAHSSLGRILLEEHQYAEAIAEFEKATVLSPENAQFQAGLGRAYAETGKSQQAVAAFEKAAALAPSPETLDEVAFHLADEKLSLDKAKQYAETAIGEETERLRRLDLARVTSANLGAIEEIAAFWDTLGWIYFEKNDLGRAANYVRAAWLLSEDGQAGDHLAQIYQRLGQRDRAIHACALALAAPHATPDTRARLTLLLGGNGQIDDLVRRAKLELEALRTMPAGQFLGENARADFLVLLSPGETRARVEAVRFVGGSEDLRPLAHRLRTLDYGRVFPDPSPAKLIRRGTLACSPTGACTFTLIPPEQVRPPD